MLLQVTDTEASALDTIDTTVPLILLISNERERHERLCALAAKHYVTVERLLELAVLAAKGHRAPRRH